MLSILILEKYSVIGEKRNKKTSGLCNTIIHDRPFPRTVESINNGASERTTLYS